MGSKWIDRLNASIPKSRRSHGTGLPCRQPAALKAAVRQGADAVYVGFRDDANARHFSGLNFNDKQLESGISFAQQHNKHVYIAVNTYAQPEG